MLSLSKHFSSDWSFSADCSLQCKQFHDSSSASEGGSWDGKLFHSPGRNSWARLRSLEQQNMLGAVSWGPCYLPPLAQARLPPTLSLSWPRRTQCRGSLCPESRHRHRPVPGPLQVGVTPTLSGVGAWISDLQTLRELSPEYLKKCQVKDLKSISHHQLREKKWSLKLLMIKNLRIALKFATKPSKLDRLFKELFEA